MRKKLSISLILVFSLVFVGAFSYRRSKILGFRQYLDPEPVTLVAVGDVMLGRSVNTGMIRRDDWTWPFVQTASYLNQADVTFGNLESPFGERCNPTDSGMVFCADKRSVAGLQRAGFDVMSLANNHDLNQGQIGLEMSNNWLEEHQILGVTETEVEYLQVNNLTLAFLAFDDVSHRINEIEMARRISEAKMISDVVVVSVHWGWEYQAEPNERQVRLGRAMIEAGAKVVIGHHPHWTQTVEEYKEGVIVYSLGNFVFDQMWSEETRLGDVMEFTLSAEGVESYLIKEVKIFEYGQPRWVESNYREI